MVNPSWSTLLFRKLITNIGFRNQFINRYADELNTRFLPTNVINHIDQIYSTIEPEVEAHYSRWKDDPSVGYEITDIIAHIDYYIDNMKSFAGNRHPIVKEHIKEEFNLPNYHPLTISNDHINKGFVEVNGNLNIQAETWTGDYFETVPVKLKAIPEFGFEFSHWSGDIAANSETIEVLLSGEFEVIPNFISNETNIPIVINEINYRSIDTLDTDDWIELYNPNTSAINISNWKIKDQDDTHIFNIPVGTQIQGEDYLVIVKNVNNFTSIFPNTPCLGELNFGLGGNDAVRLYDQNGTLQDLVDYQSISPWPSCADETGFTLELISPELDNELPDHWNCVNLSGSPNNINYNSIQSSPLSQILNFPSGWSIFSSYMISNDMNVASVISPINENVIIVKDFVGAAYLTDWEFNGIGDFLVGQGYQIKTNDSVSLEIFGAYAFPEDHPILLSQGWNMIGYLREEPLNTSEVFSEINDSGNILIVKDYLGSAFLPEWDFNGIGDMQPGEGYQVKMINEDILNY